MQVYRICRSEYAGSLNASGYAARWNDSGQFVIYASASRSLAALELLARRNGGLFTVPYSVMVIDVDAEPVSFTKEELPSNWRSMAAYGALRHLGSDWYRSVTSLVLKVPSVLVPNEFNYILNTRHPDFERLVKQTGTEDFDWDLRLKG